MFFLPNVLFWPFLSLTLGDLLSVSVLDLFRILGSTRGWFPVKYSGPWFSFRFRFFANYSLFASRIMEAQDSHIQPTAPVPICSLSQRTQPFVAPLLSPEMVSLRLDLGALNQLRFSDPDHFRGGTVHDSLPVWESLLADFNCSSVDLLEIVQDGVQVERFFTPF